MERGETPDAVRKQYYSYGNLQETKRGKHFALCLQANEQENMLSPLM